MDYTDPADRRLRDEPTKPLSPEEAVIAANQYQLKVVENLFAMLQGGKVPHWLDLNPSLPNHSTDEKENTDPRYN